MSINGIVLFVMTVFSVSRYGSEILYLEKHERVDGIYYHVWVQMSCIVIIALPIAAILLVKGIPGLCLGFCPRLLIRCKKSICRRRGPLYNT